MADLSHPPVEFTICQLQRWTDSAVWQGRAVTMCWPRCPTPTFSRHSISSRRTTKSVWEPYCSSGHRLLLEGVCPHSKSAFRNWMVLRFVPALSGTHRYYAPWLKSLIECRPAILRRKWRSVSCAFPFRGSRTRLFANLSPMRWCTATTRFLVRRSPRSRETPSSFPIRAGCPRVSPLAIYSLPRHAPATRLWPTPSSGLDWWNVPVGASTELSRASWLSADLRRTTAGAPPAQSLRG